MDYGFTHAGRVYTPNGTAVSKDENDARNAAIEAAELAHIAAAPDRFTAYLKKVDGAYHVTTWCGAVICRATKGATWRTPRSYVSSTMSTFYCRIGGREYIGRSGGDGLCINFKARRGAGADLAK